ncbi:hypothetical protein L249_3680 [Ophiocordyceps polyrhachis-furcata BCC 54312]|uniref:Uncharacterized protein n=1 Tax=Ophiocordyceps polyrhachis-furcata BCC 54312 TaxID=1330021 RepID=A0A367L4R4_9HYPO|nr:hypothetical protein L249_3680 [Ophiocordyceps polyrhachis-furcata BCC 54312]
MIRARRFPHFLPPRSGQLRDFTYITSSPTKRLYFLCFSLSIYDPTRQTSLPACLVSSAASSPAPITQMITETCLRILS